MSLQTVELSSPAVISVHRPKSLDALRALVAETPAPHYFLAGGTDLLVAHKDGAVPSSTWIDVTALSSLAGIEVRDARVRIGALTTHEDMARSPLLARFAPALVEGCAVIGGPQIRWRGTLGGNIANASPAADTVPALFTLGAQVELLAVDGSVRSIDISELALAPRKTIMAAGELITSVSFEARDGVRGGFLRLGQRQAQAISKVSVAVTAILQGGGTPDHPLPRFSYLRIACGSVAPTVIRAPRTEQLLLEGRLDAETVAQAVATIREEVRPIDDLRSTRDYRREMSGILLRRLLTRM